MSGYFRRLIARSTGTASDIRPLSAQPYATFSQATLQADQNDQLTDTHHAANLVEETNREHPDWDKKSSTKAIEIAEVANKTDIEGSIDSSILTQLASESAVTTGKSHTQTKFSKTKIAPLFDNIHEMTSQDLSHEGVENSLSPSLKQPVFVRPETTADNASEQSGRLSAEALHLMPLQSPSFSRKILSSSRNTPISSLSSMRDDKGAPSHTNLFASEEYHQTNASESATVQVSIGRIEIRATASPAPGRKASARSPAMSLDEYLKQRNGGKR